MIKAHKPRGHFWTHASTFQQTEGFRDILFEECIPPQNTNVLRYAEEVLSKAEREAKRRRIQKLANDFLDGKPLFISSARPCVQALKSTIVRSKADSDEAKLEFPDFDLHHEASAVWEDVEEDEEVLERLKRRAASSTSRDNSKLAIADVQAHTSCEPIKEFKVLKINDRPSNEALKLAATLRARVTRRANSEVPPALAKSPSVTKAAPSNVEPGTSDGHRRTRQWLSRRESRTSSGQGIVDEDSADELRLSRTETPATPSHTPRSSNISRRTSQRVLGQTKAPVQSSLPLRASQKVVSDECNALHADNCTLSGAPSEDERSHEKMSFRTAPEQTESETVSHAFTRNSSSQNCSNAVSLRSPGIPAVQLTTWTPINKPSTGVREEPSVATTDLAPGTCTMSSMTRHPLVGSAGVSADHSSKVNRPKSAGTDTPRMLSISKRTVSTTTTRSKICIEAADQESHVDEVLPKYKNVIDSRKDSTPFMFRKRASEASGGDTKQDLLPARERRGQRRITFSASEQAEPEAYEMDAGDGKHSVTEEQRGHSPFWAGTQAMLSQAQKDLVLSPEKQRSIHEIANEGTSQVHDNPAVEAPMSIPQGVSSRFSSEPMPSTQALLGDFNGFSTVKKPRSIFQNSLLPTPTAMGHGNRAANSTKRLSVQAYNAPTTSDSELSRSNPRVPITSVETPSGDGVYHRHTPTPQHAEEFIPRSATDEVPTPKSSIARRSGLRYSVPQQEPSSVPKAAADDTTTGSFSPGPPFSSFQNARASIALLRDDSNISRTIDDLARECLDTNDISGAWSESG